MLLGSALSKLPASHAAYLTGHSFFPSLISAPFHTGLDIAFDFAIVACLIAAVASLLRGKQYIHELHSASAIEATADIESAADVAESAEVATPGVAGVAEVPATARLAVAEEIKDYPERAVASPEPAIRFRKEG